MVSIRVGKAWLRGAKLKSPRYICLGTPVRVLAIGIWNAVIGRVLSLAVVSDCTVWVAHFGTLGLF